MRAVVFLFILMVGCTTIPPVDKIEVDTHVKTIPITPPDEPNSIVWKKVRWTVLTPEIMEDLLIKNKKGLIDENQLVFFAVTTNGYENLSVNMAEVIRYLKQQKAVIMYYKNTVP